MNETPQNDRTWNDVFALVLFATGAFTSALLVLALTDDPVSGQASTKVAAMGHALLWAGGTVPVVMLSLAGLLLGAGLFLGYQDTPRVARHFGGALGMAVGVSVVLGAFSESAGGLLGIVIGGGLGELSSAPVAAVAGLGIICATAWAVWLAPSRARAWEKAREIEKSAVPLQAKADGVTTEESAALAFEGEVGIAPEETESPYPEDVRIRGEIPEGAAALGAEETSNHDEITGQSGDEWSGEITSTGSQAAAGAESEGDALLLEAEQGYEESAGQDLAVGDEPAALDAATAAAPEDELSWQDAEEDSPEEESPESSGADEVPSQSEAEEEDSEGGEFENKARWESDDSEYEDEEEEAEEEDEGEGEGGEHEDAAELGEEEEEDEDAAGPEEEEGEYEDAAELEEEEEELEEEVQEMEASPDSLEEQGELFGSNEGAPEPGVILQPQAKPDGVGEEILMKAADLFLDRDRVAVSLLQRQFDIDFEESCAILDELQEMGLIGPYMGGNRRDILLTRDEWLGRVGEAS